MSSPYRKASRDADGAVEIPRTFRERVLGVGVQLTRVALVALSLAGVIFGGSAIGTYCARRPPPPCVEAVEIINVTTSARSCLGGSRVVTRDLGSGTVEVRCVCPSPDGGSQ